MPKPIDVRERTREERGRRQIVLMISEEHLTARQIGTGLRCSNQCVGEALSALEQEGVECLRAKSHRKHHLQTKFSADGLERPAGLARQSPHQYGYANSLW